MNRRGVLLGLAGLPFASRALAGSGDASALLKRAIVAAGGVAALRRVRTLAWMGTARIHAGERSIDIGVSTRVSPFVGARSDSWLLSDGPTKTRSLIVDDEQGWIERDRVRTPMPAAMLAHERKQYALYGLMLLTPLLGPGGNVQGLSDDCFVAIRNPAAPTDFCLTPDGRLASGRNTVPDPESGAPVEQRFRFEGTIESNGVKWPRSIFIEQNGKPYFDLTLTTFEALPD